MKREAGGQGKFSVGRIFGAATPPEARQDFRRSHAPRGVPPKSERPSSASYVAGCDATSRRAARPTENSPENSPENPVLPLRVS
jgi:hypothetical protein